MLILNYDKCVHSKAKSFVVPTFEQRRAKILTRDDLEKQMRLSVQYVKRIKNASRDPALSLAQKIELGKLQKAAESVVRQLRRSVFDIEDEINAQR